MRQKLKELFSNILRYGLSIALLVYLYFKIDIAKTAAVVKSADMEYIGYALLVSGLIYVVILVRWWILIRALSLEVRFGQMTRYFFIGLFGNLFLPSSIGGDVIKVWGLCRHTSAKPKVVASVILDRLSGFGGIVVVAIISFAAGYKVVNDLSLLLSIAFMALASFGLSAVLFQEKIYSFCCTIFRRFPKIQKTLMNIHYDIALLKNRLDAIYKAVAMSCVTQVLLSVVFFLTGKALHQDVALVYWMIFVPLICVASSLPSIGGLGVREAGAAFLLAKVGVDPGIAVSISLINFLFMVVAGLVGGVIYLSMKTQHLLDIPVEKTVS